MIDLTQIPLVTIVTPSYNQGMFIEATILSVLNQDYPNIEYFVIDGGSSDNTIDILKKYENRLIWISEPDIGQSQAINKGFQLGRGEILGWLNSDDTYEPGAIRTVAEYLGKHADIMMVYGEGNLMDIDGNFIKRFPTMQTFDLWAFIFQLSNFMQPSTFFRKNAICTLGLLDTSMHWYMDFEYWLRIGSRFNVGHSNYVLSNTRIYPATKTARGGIKRLYELFSVINKYSSNTFIASSCMFIGGLFASHLKYKHTKIYNCFQSHILLCKSFLKKIISNHHGVYADDWLGKKARFMLPVLNAVSHIRIGIEFPEDTRLIPNQICAELNGKAVSVLSCATPGCYQLKIPCNSIATAPIEIVLIFSRALPPDSQRRRLACKLVSVDFVS